MAAQAKISAARLARRVGETMTVLVDHHETDGTAVGAAPPMHRRSTGRFASQAARESPPAHRPRDGHWRSRARPRSIARALIRRAAPLGLPAQAALAFTCSSLLRRLDCERNCLRIRAST
jgi:hypothetical protein